MRDLALASGLKENFTFMTRYIAGKGAIYYPPLCTYILNEEKMNENLDLVID